MSDQTIIHGMASRIGTSAILRMLWKYHLEQSKKPSVGSLQNDHYRIAVTLAKVDFNK